MHSRKVNSHSDFSEPVDKAKECAVAYSLFEFCDHLRPYSDAGSGSISGERPRRCAAVPPTGLGSAGHGGVGPLRSPQLSD